MLWQIIHKIRRPLRRCLGSARRGDPPAGSPPRTPPADFKLSESGNASAKIAFTVDNLEDYVRRMAEHGYDPFIAPHDEGFGPVAAFRDPEGNLLELVELKYEFKSA